LKKRLTELKKLLVEYELAGKLSASNKKMLGFKN
jgi:hypothetical protein